VSCAGCAGQRGASGSQLHKRSVMTSQGTTRPQVHVGCEDQTISIRPAWVRARPRLLSVEQVIERIEDLRSLIPVQVTRDG
jgi:hypothetical protein